MSIPFSSQQGLVLVHVELTGSLSTAILRLALDTGATATMINAAPLVALGYDPALAPDRVEVTTASGVQFVSRLRLQRFQALGQDRTDFPVLCHTLPPSAGVDGLLGLDFFRGQVLTLDFRMGRITLA